MSARPPTFAELVAHAAATSRLTRKDVRLAAKHLLNAVMESCWRYGNAEIPGYLSVRTGLAKARNIRNPVTGEPMRLPAARVMAARVSRRWRRRRA